MIDKPSKVAISPDYESLVSKLTDEEYAGLKQSIKENGQQVPIMINEEGIILDGHHRYRACSELGIEPKTVIMKFDSKIQERLFVIDANLVRRHLNTYQRGVLALKKKPVLAELAKENMKQGRVSQNKETLHVDEQLAREAGMSKGQLYKIEKIENGSSNRLRELVTRGELTINQAYKLVGMSDSGLDLFLSLKGQYDDLLSVAASLPAGSEQQGQALDFLGKVKSHLDSITEEDWKAGKGWKKSFLAICGGEDKFMAVQFAGLIRRVTSVPEAERKKFLGTEEEDKIVMGFLAKMDNMNRFSLISLSKEEKQMMFKIASHFEQTMGLKAQLTL